MDPYEEQVGILKKLRKQLHPKGKRRNPGACVELARQTIAIWPTERLGAWEDAVAVFARRRGRQFDPEKMSVALFRVLLGKDERRLASDLGRVLDIVMAEILIGKTEEFIRGKGGVGQLLRERQTRRYRHSVAQKRSKASATKKKGNGRPA